MTSKGNSEFRYGSQQPLHASRSRRRKNRRAQIISLLFLPISMLFIELMTRLFVFGFVADRGLFYIPLLSLTGGFLLSFIGTLLPRGGRRIYTGIVLAVVGVYFSFHLVYFGIFRSFFSFQTLDLAGAVTQFWSQTLKGIVTHLHQIIIVFLPLILFLLSRRFFDLPSDGDDLQVLGGIGAAFLIAISAIVILLIPSSRIALIYMREDVDKAIRYNGLGLATMADAVECIIQPSSLNPVDNPYDTNESEVSEAPDEPIVKPIEYNQLDIDFDALISSAPNDKIKDMHRYFASVPATEKNEYTGMFKGKNLIFLTLEGFSDKVVDPVITPTLYKMANEGFRFTHFYDTPWGGSTATGEYANMTGNFYSTANCLKKSGSTLQYSSLGNLWRNAGYATYAYHNNTYTYYSRNLSHPNFGYNYHGIGNGLEVPFNGWPRSDKEMGEASIDDYINSDKPFHAYYMTVSGHANYSWTGNSMSKWHQQDLPADLTYSEGVKAYIACQMEVDLMLKSLIERLEAAGKLQDTVFAMACDHYPYALSDNELSELYGMDVKDIHNDYELYRNGFILWCADMAQPVTVDTPCSSYDIVPTLANLFGLDYDSRVISGKDILSNTENIVIINTLSSGGSWNWITSEGRYSTVSKKFTPSETCTLTTEEEISNYVSDVNKRLRAMRTYSVAILDNNYYKYVFDAAGKPLKTLSQTTATSAAAAQTTAAQ